VAPCRYFERQSGAILRKPPKPFRGFGWLCAIRLLLCSLMQVLSWTLLLFSSIGFQNKYYSISRLNPVVQNSVCKFSWLNAISHSCLVLRVNPLFFMSEFPNPICPFLLFYSSRLDTRQVCHSPLSSVHELVYTKSLW
jgi:hypothetical protein